MNLSRPAPPCMTHRPAGFCARCVGRAGIGLARVGERFAGSHRKVFPAPRPENFEIHATEISNPRNGYFKQLAIAKRLAFRDEWFRVAQKHALKFVYRAISKKRFLEWSHTSFGAGVSINPHVAAFPLVARVVDDLLKSLPVLLWGFLFRTKIVKSSEMLKRPSGFCGAWKEF